MPACSIHRSHQAIKTIYLHLLQQYHPRYAGTFIGCPHQKDEKYSCVSDQFLIAFPDERQMLHGDVLPVIHRQTGSVLYSRPFVPKICLVYKNKVMLQHPHASISYILDNRMTDVLTIHNNRLHLLAVELPLQVNETGSIVHVNDTELDEVLSGRLTYEIWSLHHLSARLMLHPDDQEGKIAVFREKTVQLLIQLLIALENSPALDLRPLVDRTAGERTAVKKALYELAGEDASYLI